MFNQFVSKYSSQFMNKLIWGVFVIEVFKSSKDARNRPKIAICVNLSVNFKKGSFQSLSIADYLL